MKPNLSKKKVYKEMGMDLDEKEDMKEAMERVAMHDHLSHDKRRKDRHEHEKEAIKIAEEYDITYGDLFSFKDSLRSQGKKVSDIWKI